jgi:hypothetical protein
MRSTECGAADACGARGAYDDDRRKLLRRGLGIRRNLVPSSFQAQCAYFLLWAIVELGAIMEVAFGALRPLEGLKAKRTRK